MKKFTLIELLVVIAVIGVLVTLLMPSLNKAREMSKRAVCLSNQSQLFKANTVYSINNQRLLIAAANSSQRSNVDSSRPSLLKSNTSGWDLVKAHSAGNELWKCPTADNPNDEDTFSTFGASGNIYGPFNYFPGRKEPLIGNSSSGIYPNLLSLMEPDFPVIMDYYVLWKDGTYRVNHGEGPVMNWSANTHYKSNGFGWGANIIFADGSGKFFKHSSMEIVGPVTGSHPDRLVFSVKP
jgi:prepilin-type N-terminal cleavage/methylation domain-containing protein